MYIGVYILHMNNKIRNTNYLYRNNNDNIIKMITA